MSKYEIEHGNYRTSGPPMAIKGPVGECDEDQLVDFVSKMTFSGISNQEALQALRKRVGDLRAARILRKVSDRLEVEVKRLQKNIDQLQKQNSRLQKENDLLLKALRSEDPFTSVNQDVENTQPQTNDWQPS